MNAPRLGGERNPREAKTMVRRRERERGRGRINE